MRSCAGHLPKVVEPRHNAVFRFGHPHDILGMKSKRELVPHELASVLRYSPPFSLVLLSQCHELRAYQCLALRGGDYFVVVCAFGRP
jgi:hypothetical protein